MLNHDNFLLSSISSCIYSSTPIIFLTNENVWNEQQFFKKVQEKQNLQVIYEKKKSIEKFQLSSLQKNKRKNTRYPGWTF
jgi:hypothetical protein